MPIPVVAGDIGAIYTFPSSPPLTAAFAMVSGSTKVFFGGRSVMLVGQAQTTGGPILLGTLFTFKTFVEGRPVHLGGSVTILSTGWVGGILQATGVAGRILVN